jgi:hypothetical protein
LVSALAVVTINGCGNNDLVAEEGKIMPDNENKFQGNNMTQEYKTATFALG